MKKSESERSRGESAKKAYQTPKLEVFGNLADITESTNKVKRPDGGGPDARNFTE